MFVTYQLSANFRGTHVDLILWLQNLPPDISLVSYLVQSTFFLCDVWFSSC
jgi:hypothetical protein